MPPNKDSNERKLNLRYIEDLYTRLFYFPIESIRDGLIAEGWTDEVLKNRLKTARLLLKDWITPDGIAQFETDDLLSTESESMKYVCSKLGVTDGRKYMLKVFTLFREANLNIHMVAKTLKEVENLIAPQPGTSTEQEQTVRRSPITDDKEIKEIFDEAVNRKFMSYTDKGIKWLRGNPLLAYFCVKLSTYRNLSEKVYEDKDNEATNWSVFGGIFLTKRQGGNWELADATKLHDYKFGNMKGKTEFHPKGYKEIDDLILEFS